MQLDLFKLEDKKGFKKSTGRRYLRDGDGNQSF